MSVTTTVVGVHFGFSGGIATGATSGTALIITSISESTGSAGDVVTFTGSGFTGVTSIQFGTLPSLAVTVISDTSMTAVVPTQLPVVTRAVGPYGTGTGPTFTYVGAGSVGNPNFTITAVKTTTYSAAFNDFVRADPTGGALAVNLPAANTSSSTANMIIVANVATSGSNLVTVTTAGADTIGGSGTTTTLSAQESIYLTSDGASNWMKVVS